VVEIGDQGQNFLLKVTDAQDVFLELVNSDTSTTNDVAMKEATED